MQLLNYGDVGASTVLIQPVDDHDLVEMDAEIAEIRGRVKVDFQLIAVKVNSWNQDLSPWQAPAVFGKEDFGSGAAEMLQFILEQCRDRSKTYYLGGYSLAGLFSLWAAYQTDRFAGAAAASPSIWFPDFLQYMREHDIRTESVYLSLGDREEKTRNPVMAAVGDCIREGYELLKQKGVRTTLEWNPGNHFKDAGIRTAKAFAWVMNR
jgi:predicted alpha/beta superfamily hydrolase